MNYRRFEEHRKENITLNLVPIEQVQETMLFSSEPPYLSKSKVLGITGSKNHVMKNIYFDTFLSYAICSKDSEPLKQDKI